MSKLRARAGGGIGWWGTSSLLCLLFAVAAIASPAQTFNTLVNFDWTNGANPAYMALVQGTDGSLYGTTGSGGANGLGTVFKVTPTGTLTTLYNFAGTDGANPLVGLVLGTDGNFYGTTQYGGANDGTVFKINSRGTLTTLYSFAGTDGAGPAGPLVQASDGNFYGLTSAGGLNGDCSIFQAGCGTVFKMTPGGTLTTLYDFAAYPTDGSNPNSGLIQAADGNFYGTTEYGGTNNSGCSSLGCGTIFKITPAGTETTLYNFAGVDGANPIDTLVQATDGNFYGTTANGGTGGDGTVFKITSAGTLTTLYNFAGSDGANPRSGALVLAAGNFYGTTSFGGASADGTIFKITPTGVLTTLHSFDSTDGYQTQGGLLQATNGTFYGATWMGGTSDPSCTDGTCGTVFRLGVGLGPFVEAVPTSGRVGKAVKILGTNLTGTTSVTFNGVSAMFTVARTFITTTVPSGAMTGYVQVTTPHGTLKSNVVFRVRP